MIICTIRGQEIVKCARSPTMTANRLEDGRYMIRTDAFAMSVNADDVMILDDSAEAEDGAQITDAMRAAQIAIESLITLTQEQAAAEIAALTIRARTAIGEITDADLLQLKSVLGRRLWRAGLQAVAGDVYADGGALYRCIGDHITAQDLRPRDAPQTIPALWARVEERTGENA